ncbi:pYEATS domain-containing protein [Chitinophaga tropicalis]|uniref:YEATS domain-containing protein n=1 Tax=Chitinophaga tropicalis TaxID=2683588 RepID=A0A7K1U6L2_9BACT|nr:pYEATS domain-containing protein [Chitinophaga tropicalis]MVT09998.1 hypothetical protein [Chitinophaga tropicalis]
MPTKDSRYKIDQGYEYQGDDWWEWWIWIEADKEDLDIVDHVIYTLHPTFYEPVQTVKDREEKFKLLTEGWGTFTIHAKIVLQDSTEIPLKHKLHLAYPDGSENTE